MADAQLRRFESMTNVELRAELKQRGCPTSGNKKDLLAKLSAALQKEYEQNIPQPLLNYSVDYPQNEIPMTYTNLPIHDQSTVYNLTVTENTYPVIPITQQISESSTSEKKIRTRSKKLSVDSRTNEIISNSTSINNEQIILDTSNNVEMNSFVSKSNEEEEKNIEKLGGEIHLSSVGSSNYAKTESIVKEIPLSDDEQQRFNQSETINEKQNSAIHITNDDIKNQNEIIDQSSKSADLQSITTKQQEITKEEESEKLISQPNRRQISSLIKGLNRSINNKINLSSDLLKTLIPDLSLVPESTIDDELNNESNILHDFIPSDSMTIGELADQKPQTNRIVAIDDLTTRKNQNLIPTRIHSFESKILIDEKNNTVTDEPIRIKDVTIGNEPPSQILYIRGLTRPFSLMQLKGLLNRYGILIDGEFWLDKIKSQCFVTYKTLEEAQNAREALDGCRWPLTNPKTLSVRFGRQDEFEFSKTHDLPPDHMSTGQNSEARVIEEESTSPVNGIESKNHSNEPKLHKEKQSAFLITEEEEEEEESVKPNEQSMKGLDDYFRKTKAKPSIYWLPLTDEQIIERTDRQKQRNAEREEEQRKREIDENVHKSEKRKLSSSPSRQNHKRY